MPIPKDFKNTTVIPTLQTMSFPLVLFGYPTIELKYIAESLRTNIVDAYLIYVPYIIRYDLFKTLPYPEAISCNSEGIIKIVNYKKFFDRIDRLLKYYCYELISEEPFEERNNKDIVILKYKLKVEEV